MHIAHNAAAMLSKRDNMGFALAPSLIIFLVILGGGALVCIGFAVYRFWGDELEHQQFKSRTPEQDQYMREVRERNWSKIPRMGRNVYRPSHQNMAHAPMSMR